MPWVMRSVIAGAAGTATMTLAYGLERRLRHSGGPLDYDDSLVPGQIVAGILRLPRVTGREERSWVQPCAGVMDPPSGCGSGSC